MSSTSAPSAAGHPGPATAGVKKFNGFNVPALLSWRDPVKTGTLAGEAIIAWVVLSSSLALRIFLRLNAYFLFLIAALEFSTRLINGKDNGLIGSYRPSRFLPREQAIQNISASIAKNVRSALYGIEHLLDTRNPGLNLSLAFGSYVLYKILGWISIRNLALTLIITVFTAPVAYLQFKPQVDEAVTQLQAHLSTQQAKLEKIAHEKAGNQINFVKKFTNNSSRGGFPAASGSAAGSAAGSSASASTGVSTGVSGSSLSGSSSTAPLNGSSSTAPLNGSSSTAPLSGSSSTAPLSGSSSTAPLSGSSSTAPLGSTSTAPLSSHSTAPLSSHSTPSTHEPINLNAYTEVPSLAGTVKLDQAKVNEFTDAQALRDSIQKDKSY